MDKLTISNANPTKKNRRRNNNRKCRISGEVEKKAAKKTGQQPINQPNDQKQQVNSLAHLTDVSFASLGLSEQTLRGLTEKLNFQFLTQVQHQTLPFILKGEDMLAKARTGTGKTVAFLLPCIERMHQRKSNDSISMLVISPTRELASQIAEQARDLVFFHQGIRVACVVGGTNVKTDQKKLKQHLDILVATPGRLIDHLQTLPDLSRRLQDLAVLALDEADRLLDMGFRPEIEKILRYLPGKEQRQTLLFSATTPQALIDIKSLALKKTHQFIDTVGDDQEQTNARTLQYVAVTPFDQQIYALSHELSTHIATTKDFKVIVFFPTARQAGFMAQLFDETSRGMKVVEMHSRKNQNYRTKVADQFRKTNQIVMFSSDVSARGVDYPDVTLVIQVGLTDREQYIHRVGRTSRAGQTGQGILLLADFESKFLLHQLDDLPLQSISIDLPDMMAHDMSKSVENKIAFLTKYSELCTAAKQCYISWLGFYNGYSKRLGWSKLQLVDRANQFSEHIGLPEPPAILKKTVGKMGLKGVKGLRLE